MTFSACASLSSAATDDVVDAAETRFFLPGVGVAFEGVERIATEISSVSGAASACGSGVEMVVSSTTTTPSCAGSERSLDGFLDVGVSLVGLVTRADLALKERVDWLRAVVSPAPALRRVVGMVGGGWRLLMC